ncbi:6,7-dimethyl-8-ribityllumazine synthase [Aliifodinibius salipaludis]|uniref:6,7-dimethyl-8-ribityllumazine synthase n=1 Tax=Fodinibius salipaludis TaxID=2032627 RepID=A0A2A2G958_9BACT|nr:6,7-dimethyl-8-ribityllumazine synthase [Aliifodinibius salipaludis]PAU93385.1 6,7-dimethyl-8-ribityllumazine synthase [Aliifodinibius salipaludis]
MADNILQGDTVSNKFSIGIAIAKWNSFITDELLEGALNTLKSKGFGDEQILIARCPGAYELPFTAKKLLEYTDGVITLGAVIQGDTPHFDYVCDAVNRGVTDLNLKGNKPVVFGVLTTDNVAQAQERSGLKGDKGNKGAEAALALIEMISLTEKFEKL